MLNYIQYLNMPTKVAFILVVIFFVIQIIGEVLEFRGKVVPEFIKIRKYFIRKKKEKEAIRQMPELLKEFQKVPDTLQNVQKLLNEVSRHYSKDNITMRDNWIKDVNCRLEENDKKQIESDKLIRLLDEKIDKNNADTLSLLIDSKRNTIINFASRVIDENFSVTKEQFNRVLKLYEEYENIIEKNGLTNGEVNIAYRIITESYEKHMKNHTFIEDIRGYNV